MENVGVDDGYWVVFADTTKDDRIKRNKGIEETGYMKKFRSFIFPAKYHDEAVKTAEELLSELNKPNAKIIHFIDKNKKPFVYDRVFFERVECGDEFMDLWDTIVRDNPSIAHKVMTKLFRAISQTALKIECLSKTKLKKDDNINVFFEKAWGDNNEYCTSYETKMFNKFGEMSVLDQGQRVNMMYVYNKLQKQFPRFGWCIENICYHTFLRIHDTLDFGPLITMSKKDLN